MYHLHDPLLEIEKSHQKNRTIFSSLGRTLRFLTIYLALTGTIFTLLLSLLNYSAYSSRVMNWVNPDTLLKARDEIAGIVSASSVEVHASEESATENKEDLETVKEKILSSDPSIVYSQNYEAKNLIAPLQADESAVTFRVTPYENRLIIPRIGKNIPLIDVSVASGASFETMHEVFMEELKK